VNLNDDLYDDLHEKLQVEYRESQSREKVASRDTKKANRTNYSQHYKDLFAIEEEYSKTHHASSKHIIALLYSKGLFDDACNLIPPSVSHTTVRHSLTRGSGFGM
jgi:predicted transcriptional regulator YheO